MFQNAIQIWLGSGSFIIIDLFHITCISYLSQNLERHAHIVSFLYPRKKCNTNQQNRKNMTTPAQKIHLSCRARLSTILIVSLLIPSVAPTSYNLFCVPLSISLCVLRSESTALPRSKYSSSWAFPCWKNDCSLKACDSLVPSYVFGPPKDKPPDGCDGANADCIGKEDCAYGFSGVDV